MRNYDELFRGIKFPESTKDTQAVIDYNEEVKQLNADFWLELGCELGWDKLPTALSDKLKDYVRDSASGYGYNETYIFAVECNKIINAVLKD